MGVDSSLYLSSPGIIRLLLLISWVCILDVCAVSFPLLVGVLTTKSFSGILFQRWYSRGQFCNYYSCIYPQNSHFVNLTKQGQFLLLLSSVRLTGASVTCSGFFLFFYGDVFTCKEIIESNFTHLMGVFLMCDG